MKQLFTGILFIIISGFSWSQQREVIFNLDKKGDTNEHYLNQINLSKQIGVKRFENTSDKFHFRLTTDREIIDVGENVTGGFYGSVTHWVTEVAPDNEAPIDRKFAQTIVMPELQAKQIIEMVKVEKATEIPDQREVPYWSTRPSGTTFFIEHSDAKTYAFKTYKAPSGQKDVPESMVIQKIINESKAIAKTSNSWKSFLVECPLECFSSGGTGVTCIPRSPKEQKIQKKLRKKYRAQK